MSKVNILLGSNTEPRNKYIQQAFNRIVETEGISLLSKTPVIETNPHGVKDQPDFLNQIIFIETIMTPIELLKFLKSVEIDTGRSFENKWGQREIDLDILTYDNIRYETDILTIPHHQIQTRPFVKELLEMMG
ncbi:MAG: 2-amino-4-hydroxy-6-hydroxymethyldihydropteridine diphosphokinase [Candidatus Muirbacterium halophilum]|nr:2-amino-4-hydroxy-6-hydroxymethyldihydropteridine diphosphokinase [Candidatus Muirbacterium halophilum]MCK9475343.1 2-amino-4-hydroxy-6-hydroxymethyldihydropteridine diphosphokinase [Candidatus Muirbacterium halophilum]